MDIRSHLNSTSLLHDLLIDMELPDLVLVKTCLSPSNDRTLKVYFVQT